VGTPPLQVLNPGSPNQQPSGFAAKTIQAESRGNPNAKARTSRAVGAAQFIPSTWLAMMDKYHPELTIGKTLGQVLNLRKNPQLAAEMTDHYGNENAQHLAAKGLPVSDVTKYMAHFLGPEGAEKILTARIGTPVAQLLPVQVIRANRAMLLGKKAEDVLREAQRKMGNLPAPAAGP
jgi:hypothetical protein